MLQLLTIIPRDKSREQVFATDTERKLGFGKSVSGKAVWEAKKHYDDFVAVVGKSNAPATLDKYYELKYNNLEKYKELRELYKGFKSGKLVRNAAGQTVKIVNHTKLTGEEPNSITQKISSKGGIERNYYDENGRQYKQISNNDHGENRYKNFGIHGEHTHTYIYDERGILIGRPSDKLTDEERKENADIL